MPIEPTPLEQEVDAEALKLTLPLTVLPFAGLLTVTPAIADATEKRTNMAAAIGTCFFILTFLRLDFRARARKPL
jgi:hypothetical protein